MHIDPIRLEIRTGKRRDTKIVLSNHMLLEAPIVILQDQRSGQPSGSTPVHLLRTRTLTFQNIIVDARERVVDRRCGVILK